MAKTQINEGFKMKKMNKKSLLILIILTSLTIIIQPNLAQPPYTTLYVNPPLKMTSPEQTVSIDIAVDNVTDLAGYDFMLVYNSTIINGTQITQGPFLKSGGANTYFYIVNFTDDYYYEFPWQPRLGVAYVVSFVYGPTGVNGSGTLATITFKAKRTGDAILFFNLTKTQLYNSDLENIPINANNGTIRSIPPDVAITNITPSPTTILQGQTAQINVTAQNQGGRTETFNVTAYYATNTIGKQTITNLTPGTSKTLTFNWNTAGVPAGTYTIKAEASIVSNETDTADNTLTDGTIKVIKPPVASFTYTPTNPRALQPVTFNATSSTPNGGTITSYKWDFGDANITTIPNPIITHTYAVDGIYTVNLTITDSEGLTDSTAQTIGVGVALIHDIAITNLPCPANIYSGTKVNVTVTVENQGDYYETFNITIYYNTTTMGNLTITDLSPKTTTPINFLWDTKGVTTGNYTLSANTTQIPGETDTADNNFTNGVVRVKLLGDTDGDNDVDSSDLFTLAAAYGSKKGQPLYKENCDFDLDGDVDSADLFALAANYGKEL